MKVIDNNIERDATPSEEVNINKMGGGTSRFELVASGTIENITRKAITIDGYDEVYVALDSLTGSGHFVIQAMVGTTTTTTTTRLNNFLTDTAKYVKSLHQRLVPTDFLITYNATSVNTTSILTTLATPEGITYDDKINKVVIACTGTDSIIESCDYKIYGRNLINESI